MSDETRGPTNDRTTYVYGTEPREYQREAFELSRDRPTFALLDEMGLGKTKVLIDTACWLHQRGDVDRVLVVAPSGVHANWVLRELPKHLPAWCASDVFEWRSSRATGKRYNRELDALMRSTGRLRWLCMNIEALSSKRGEATAKRFLRAPGRASLMVIDESTKIKKPARKRTRAAMRLRRFAHYRRIMTGTPVTQSPFDVYSQFRFLDPAILGFQTAAAFRSHYAVIETGRARNAKGELYEYPSVKEYRRLDDLKRRIAPYSIRRTKAEVLDLPPKIYSPLIVEPSPEQRRLYHRLCDELLVEIGDTIVPVALALTRIIRLRQIVGGFLPDGMPVKGPNPKLMALLDELEDVSIEDGVVVWAWFRSELDEIARRLRLAHGARSTVVYHGEVRADARAEAIDRFQGGDARFFVANQQTAAFGLTLTRANVVYYYSDDFNTDLRNQSEDRCHRIGQTRSVVYKDMIVRNTVDETIRACHQENRLMAAQITGDDLRSILLPGDD